MEVSGLDENFFLSVTWCAYKFCVVDDHSLYVCIPYQPESSRIDIVQLLLGLVLRLPYLGTFGVGISVRV